MLSGISLGCSNGRDWQGRYAEAQQKLQDGDSDSSIKIAHDGYKALSNREPVLAWKFRVVNANALIRQYKLQDSLALLADAPANLPNDLGATVNIVKSYGLCGLGKTSDGVAFLDKAETLIGDSAILRGQLTYARGACIAESDRTHAENYFQSAARSFHGIDRYWEARALTYLGYLLMQDEHYDQAVEIFSNALTLVDSSWLKQMVLGNSGECYAELGDWKAATSFSQQAETLASGIKDAAQDRGRWLIDLGRERYSQIQFAEAEKSWLQALAIANDLQDADLKARCLNDLAMLALKRDDESRAAGYIKDAEDLRLQGEQELYLSLYKARLLRLQHNDHDAEFILNRILQGAPNPQVRYEAETDLAKLYVAQNQFRKAEDLFRAGISTAEAVFTHIGSDQFRISFLDYIPFYDEYVRFLISQNRPLDALKIAERGRSPGLRAALGFGNTLNLRNIQNRLLQNQAALVYWLSPQESYVWVITPSLMKLVKIAPEMEIVRAIDAYSQEVLDISSPESSGLGAKLYSMLVAPAARYIGTSTQIVIIPHRRLYKLNFETLVAPEPKPHYWIEDVSVQNASFLEVLQSNRQSKTRYAKDLLLIGAPVDASKDFPGLAHAPEEIEKVASHFPHAQETVIDGAPATPAAYQSSDPSQYRFFHFVTHGTASDTSPLDSAIILSPSNKGYKLYARDIIKTKIHPELVTISACYGQGTRQYSGEGLVGLAWAFMRVGAHHVVAALWEVDDAATADLMDQFYTELTSGKSEAVALRDAKLQMLHSNGPRRRPFYWASLQLQTGP